MWDLEVVERRPTRRRDEVNESRIFIEVCPNSQVSGWRLPGYRAIGDDVQTSQIVVKSLETLLIVEGAGYLDREARR